MNNNFIFSKHTFIYNNIPKTLSLFYFCIAFRSIPFHTPYLSMERYDKMDPPPILSFLELLSPEMLVFIVNITPCILILTGLLPRRRFLRFLSAVFYTCSYGFIECSFGIDGHDQLMPVYSAISLAFMPTFKENEAVRVKRHISIMYFWTFHLSFFLAYFVSGLTKVFYGGIYQLFFDNISIWSPKALANVTEYYLFMIKDTSWLKNLIVENIWLSGPMYVFATILEVACILPLWFPKLWKIVVLKLILFHIAVIYILNINFYTNLIILLIVFYNTPFGYSISFSLKNIFSDSIRRKLYSQLKSLFIKNIKG